MLRWAELVSVATNLSPLGLSAYELKLSLSCFFDVVREVVAGFAVDRTAQMCLGPWETLKVVLRLRDFKITVASHVVAAADSAARTTPRKHPDLFPAAHPVL